MGITVNVLTMRRGAVPVLSLTVGFVLADSAIVTLALPEIRRRIAGPRHCAPRGFAALS